MSNFSHKGGAHENAAKKKETKEESFAHRMETLSGETDGRKKPSKKQKTRTLTVVLIVIAGVLALLLLLLLAYSIWSTAPETDDSGLKTQTTATPDMPTASASPAGATAQPKRNAYGISDAEADRRACRTKGQRLHAPRRRPRPCRSEHRYHHGRAL